MTGDGLKPTFLEHEAMNTAFFLDDDDNYIYAAIGDMADKGLFRISARAHDDETRRQSPSDWQFLVPNSQSWDAAHQRIYNTRRVKVVEAGQAKALPELPPVPPYEPVRWADNFRPAGSPSHGDYPELAAFIEMRTLQRSSHSIDVHLVLREDDYESSFGDGKFLYLDHAFPENHWQAADCLARGKPGETLHLRRASIHLEDGRLSLLCVDRGAFDHWRDEEVFAALERFLDPATPPQSADTVDQVASRIYTGDQRSGKK